MTISLRLAAAAVAVAAMTLAAGAANARPSTISVDNGRGGWKPYEAPAKPVGNANGISVDNGRGGWKPYNAPTKPVGNAHGISVDDGNGGFKPYIAPPKPPIGGSSTYGGKTTTSTLGLNGLHLITQTQFTISNAVGQ